MRNLNVILPALLLAGSFLAPEAPAQTPTSPPGVQRAPGVPPVPSPTEIARRKAEREKAARPGERARDDRARGNPGPDGDLPMPRGVPSIIAP